MMIYIKDDYTFVVNDFLERTGFSGINDRLDASDKTLSLEGYFDLEDLVEQLKGVYNFTLLDAYLSKTLSLDISGEILVWKLEEVADYSDGVALDTYTQNQRLFLMRAKSIIENEWIGVQKNWDLITDGVCGICNADDSIPERLTSQHPNYSFTIQARSILNGANTIEVDTQFTQVDVYLASVGSGEIVAGHYHLLLEFEGRIFERSFDGVVGCLKENRDDFITDLFKPCIAQALEFQSLSAAA
jgi:hypothetical protein